MASHLTIQERDRISQLWHQGTEQKEIARTIGRSAATISRELRRNRTGNDYFAGQAQQQARRRRSERPLQRKMDDPQLNESVRQGLTQQWAPEQIAGRLKDQHPDSPSRNAPLPIAIEIGDHLSFIRKHILLYGVDQKSETFLKSSLPLRVTPPLIQR